MVSTLLILVTPVTNLYVGIIWLAISPMIFIRTGKLLSNLFHFHKLRKHPYLLHYKNLSVKMSSVLLESCKLDLPLLGNPSLIWDKPKIGKIMRACII